MITSAKVPAGQTEISLTLQLTSTARGREERVGWSKQEEAETVDEKSRTRWFIKLPILIPHFFPDSPAPVTPAAA